MTTEVTVESTNTVIQVTSGIQTQVSIDWVQGLPGPAGDGTTFTLVADQSIGGHRVVRSTATGCDYADSSILSHLGKVVGITNAATSAGQSVKIWPTGKITEPTFNFSIGPVYLSTNGTLTQTIPASGFIQQIGVATSATTLVIQILSPIEVI